MRDIEGRGGRHGPIWLYRYTLTFVTLRVRASEAKLATDQDPYMHGRCIVVARTCLDYNHGVHPESCRDMIFRYRLLMSDRSQLGSSAVSGCNKRS